MTGRAEAAYAVLRQVRPLHQHAARVVAEDLRGERLTLGSRAILERLLDVGPQTVPELAVWLSVSRQAVQRVVDEAAGLGFLEVRPNPRHRRSHLIAATDRGRRVFDDVHRRELAALEEVAADLGTDELAACARVLAELNGALRERLDGT